jgi:hypothetical protein
MSSYDPACLGLADYFLRDYDVTPPENYHAIADRLTERIHKGIEDDLSDLEAEGKIKWSAAKAAAAIKEASHE